MSAYLFIGAGVAALAAAEAVHELDPAASITLLSDDPHGYYSRPGLAYFLAGELDERILFPFQPQELNRRGFTLLHARAERILPAEKVVELDSARRISYDRLLIASGARAVPLKTPGAQWAGVHKLDSLDDARRLVDRARGARGAVVVGGGITALELAEGLAARHVKVHYLLRGERYWPNVLDESESSIIERRLSAQGIVLHHLAGLEEIEGRAGKVAAVRLSGGERIPCDLVAYAIGVAPHVDLARSAGIACERGILVDAYFRTNQPDVYAAGDAAQVFDPASGKHLLDSLWTAAREQGRYAGLNMAGLPSAYAKSIAFNVTRLAGLTTTIIGALGSGRDSDLVSIARGDSETWRQLPDALIAQSGFDENRLRLVLDQRHIIGALLMGDQGLSPVLQTLVRSRADISPIRDQLLAPGAPIAGILADFWVEYRRNPPR